MLASIPSTPVVSSVPVLFTCENDANAKRVEGVLAALGFTPRRALAPSVRAGSSAALARVFARFGVTSEREQLVARSIVAGAASVGEIASAIGCSQGTAKALKFTLLARCHVDDAYGLACLVLAQLDAVQA